MRVGTPPRQSHRGKWPCWCRRGLSPVLSALHPGAERVDDAGDADSAVETSRARSLGDRHAGDELAKLFA